MRHRGFSFNRIKPASVLIVKTSSLGDIIQAFAVLDTLHFHFPDCPIDWAVEEVFFPIVAAHPLVRRAIALPMKRRKGLWGALRQLRKERYDFIFDLQGNCKSGVVTFLAQGKVKVGYGPQSVREWPNVLSTHVRFEVSKQKNIRFYYSELVDRTFRKAPLLESSGVRFKLEPAEQEKVRQILAAAPSQIKIMVCPGSKWINKQLPLETLVSFLRKIEKAFRPFFFLMWGGESEKIFCEQIQPHLPSKIIDKLPLPTWQNLMSEVDLVIAVDSSALHLCGTTSTPSFSIFGPTSPPIFKPIGERHLAIQGPCPYGQAFEKQCPLLRTCPTGACIRDLQADELFATFSQWIGGVFQNRRVFQPL